MSTRNLPVPLELEEIHCNLIQNRAKTFYKICRRLLICDLHYNSKTQRLEQRTRNKYLRLLIQLLLAFVSLSFSFSAFVLAAIALGAEHTFGTSDSFETQRMVLLIGMSIARSYTTLYMLKKLLSRCIRKSLERLLIDVLDLRAKVRDLTGVDVAVMPQLRKFLRMKHIIVVAQLCSVVVFGLTGHYPWPYFLLIEVSYYAYQTMQLTLLGQYRDINALLERGNTCSRRRAVCAARCRKTAQRLSMIMSLLYRLKKVHRKFTELFYWYPRLIFVTIFSCVFNLSNYIVCLFLHFEPRNDSFAFILFKVVALEMPFIVLPWFKMALMASINDSLQEESKFSLDLFMIAIAKLPAQNEGCTSCESTKKAVELFYLDTHLHPHRISIFRGTRLDRKIALHFVTSSILYALACAQFSLFHNKECMM